MTGRRTGRALAWDVLVNRVLASALVPNRQRWRLLRRAGLATEAGAIAPDCYFGSPRVALGPGCYVNRGVFFDASDWVRLGTNVYVGMRATFCTSGHEPGDRRRRAGALTAAPVTVGDGSWVGAGALVLPGVTIGRGCVIAAGAVVTKDCADDGLYAGNPARRIRDL